MCSRSPARVKKTGRGTSYYHLMSRANDRRFLFESGRFHSTLVEGGRYRATCMHYVYLNPVRAGIVKRASDYAWSWIAAPEEPFAGSVPNVPSFTNAAFAKEAESTRFCRAAFGRPSASSCIWRETP